MTGFPADAISRRDRETFDRYFHVHPLVRLHTGHAGGGAQRISDCLSPASFRGSALYNEYYRKIGIDHAVAVPLYVDRRWLVSFVLNRARRDFGDRDRARLELVRRPLAALYRHARSLDRLRAALPGEPPAGLTPREREVLAWLAAGKTDRDIGEILGASPRTVQKHLQHIYEKLGVETRTAAAMRALGTGLRR